MKPSLVLAAFSPLAAFTVAEPPACLLAALTAQGNPSGVENICANLQSSMLGNITTLCHDVAVDIAYRDFSTTCNEVGVQVEPLPKTAPAPAPAPAPTASVTTASGSSAPADATPVPTSTPTSADGEEPTESKPASAAAAIAPYALLFTLFGLSTTGLFNIVFL